MGDLKYIFLPERIQTSSMKKLAWQVFQYPYFDAVLIRAAGFHIPYLGAALALMLKNFRRPVLFYQTDEEQTQAEHWARNCCPGVYALEQDLLYLACRTTYSPNAGITSPYYPPVGLRGGSGYCVYQDRVPAVEQEEAMVCDAVNENIGFVRPGFAFATPETLLEKSAYFVLLKGEEDIDWLLDGQKKLLEQLRRAQIPVVVHGFPQQMPLPLRRRVLRAGVIPTGDMTREAAWIKCMWTMARCSAPESVRLYFSLNFGGEMTQLRDYQF